MATKPSYEKPAFPAEYAKEPGMTLRQHYAGLAMQGICASGPGMYMTDQIIAEQAFKRADAMIKAEQL